MNKFLSLLAGILFFVSIHAAQPQYGVCVIVDFEKDAEKVDAIVTEIGLEFIGIRMQEPNYPVFGVNDYMHAQKIIAVLKMHGFKAEVIEVRFDDAPNANVLSIAAIEKIMQSIAPVLESLEDVEDLDEARARLTEVLEKEFAA